MKKCAILVLTMLFLGFGALVAQTSNAEGQISGRVFDEGKKAFPYATVSLTNVKDSSVVKGTLSGEDGGFQFKGLKDGSYLVSVYVVGYKKIIQGPYLVSVARPSYMIGDVQLAIDARELKAVEIVRQRPLIERQIDKTVINVENSAIAAGNSALEILEKAPGVTMDREGNVSLKGKQGVMIMLDGKPTYLSSEQLANLLRSTEGNAIQSIELITNPSAKYDAAGNSGIINIKLKKNQNYGTNGSVSAGAGYGRYHKANAGLAINHREQKLNVFGNFNYGKNKRYSGTDIVRVNNTVADKTY
ncbi:MAG: TonB-dependent receptor, partial [Pedobacter sp.]